jgi:DNA-binding transcriptional LysR family regulator
MSFGTARLAPLLAAFAVRYPDIALDVQFGDRIVNLVDEGFDAAIRIGTPTDLGLVVRKLAHVAIVTVAAPAYLARHGTPRRPSDLRAHDCIIDTNFRDPHHWPFAGGEKVPVAGRLSFSNASACVNAAEAGLGIACVPEFVVRQSLAAGRVERILDEHADQPLGVFVLYPEGRQVPAKLRVLIDFLVAAMKDDSEMEGINFQSS